MNQSDARGHRAADRNPSRGSAFDSAKRLALWTGVGVLLVFFASCGAGFAVANAGGLRPLGAVRDVGVIVLALFYLLQVVIWGAIYFAIAWVVGAYGPKLPAALRWTGGKAATVDVQTGKITERFVVRPLAGTVRRLTTVRALVSRIGADVAGADAPARRVTRELADWPTLQHRLRRGATPLPAGRVVEVGDGGVGGAGGTAG